MQGEFDIHSPSWAKIRRIHFTMPTSLAIRQQIEAALADRIPSALTPAPRTIRPVLPTGIRSIDEVLDGGLPVGAITEIVGPECSGRTGLALSFLAQITMAEKICAWIDVSNTLHPEAAAASGVDLLRLLWVRCGVSTTANLQHSSTNGFALPEKYFAPPLIEKGLHGGGIGPHLRTEAKGLSDAVRSFLRPEVAASRSGEPQGPVRNERAIFSPHQLPQPFHKKRAMDASKTWSRMDQALRVTDLLLQAGGFRAIVLDMGSIAPEYAVRVPLATWFRYRAAAEQSQTSLLLLTQHATAKSSAGLVLLLHPGKALRDERTIFTGVEYSVEVVRERFKATSSNVVPLRKPPQNTRDVHWQSRPAWAGPR
jgi:recombination protein RecA